MGGRKIIMGTIGKGREMLLHPCTRILCWAWVHARGHVFACACVLVRVNRQARYCVRGNQGLSELLQDFKWVFTRGMPAEEDGEPVERQDFELNALQTAVIDQADMVGMVCMNEGTKTLCAKLMCVCARA